MNGNNYNKLGMNNQKGQVLLLTIMLLATVLTVTLAVTFKSTTETQLTKQEEDSQKALSAAEAGVEAALKQGNVTIGGSGILPGSGFTGQASISVSTDPDTFVTPLLQKDQQYTFYLTDYTSAGLGTTYWPGFFDIYFMSEVGATPSLELTQITSANLVKRFIMNPAASTQINKLPGGDLATTGGSAWQGFNFTYKTTIAFNGANTKLLIIRTLFASTRIGIHRTSGPALPTQGKYVTSEARSTGTGVTKQVQLFQSYPQIPTEFFVTSF